MEILIKTGQLLLSLSILIALHECGHFVAAKLFKTRVEKFYLFFNPWFSLFKKKIGETEYGLGWLPLGGYVKISGMIDESMDKEQLAKDPEPWEFRAKPTWQRLIIMLGGVTVNLILGMVIYMMVLWVWGKEYLPLENATYGYESVELMHEYGFQDGDKIIGIGELTPESVSGIDAEILLGNGRNLLLERNGELLTIKLPEDIDLKLISNGVKHGIFSPRIPFVIDSVLVDRPAASSGLMKGDSIVSLNDSAVPFFTDFYHAITKNKNETVTIGFYRGNEMMSVKVKTDTAGTVGIAPIAELNRFFTTIKKTYSFGASIPAGFSFGMNTLTKYVSSLKLLFTKEGVNQIGGFGAIGGMFSPTWDWNSFWMMTALLSIMLAVMNVLPIPALDGGHVLFLLWEMITHKAPPQKFLERAQMVGMVLLLGLLLYANGNDIYKLAFN